MISSNHHGLVMRVFFRYLERIIGIIGGHRKQCLSISRVITL